MSNGVLVLVAFTEYDQFPIRGTERNKLASKLENWVKGLESGAVSWFEHRPDGGSGTRIYGRVVTLSAELVAEVVDFADIRDYEVYSRWLRDHNAQLKEELSGLTSDEQPVGESGATKDRSWQSRVEDGKPHELESATSPWVTRVVELFADLPKGEEGYEAADLIRKAMRRELAKVLADKIAKTFEGKFDADGKPTETLEQMRLHSAKIRDCLSDWDYAFKTPDGRACQLFVREKAGQPQYALVPLGSRRKTTIGKFSVTSQVLQSPELIDKPTPPPRANSRS